MAGEWFRAPFPDLIDFQEGPGILAKDFRESGVPLVRLSGLEVGASLLSGCNFLDPEMVAKRWAHFALSEGDILLSTSASLGRVATVPREGVGAIAYTGIIRMRPRDERIFAPYIRYLLAGPEFQQQVEAAGVGSVIKHFGPMHLRQMQVHVPPIEEQRAIAHILGTLDDKIELNRRMSETLEAMARALFKAWFVDFEPVRAKMEGRWRRGETLPGLPAHLYDLFPDRLVDSELGEIPEGWGVACVDDEFDVTMGQSPPGETYNETGEGMPFYQGRADFQSRFPRRRVYCTAPTRLAKAGDTLISVRAPVGDINMAGESCAIGRGVAAARHKSGSRSYTYQFMLGLKAVFARFEAEGTVFGSISKTDFQAIPCIAPPARVVSSFEAMLVPLDDCIEVAAVESHTLAALRDTLLPKLISGELRVPDAARFLEAAT
ncbi:restriction endonuclease subunit S [Deinococcus geothermalis]|uniref:restriction endonuclease subunit S n=1 Tax=Deinococcus geothermalis TaxID=68909 RepID=UPI002353CB51|nr:restriction endonuclease subunit S [Deinococcus geothermalis]